MPLETGLTFCQAHTPAIAFPSCTAQIVPPWPSRLATVARHSAALLEVLNAWTGAVVARSWRWIAAVDAVLLPDATEPFAEHADRISSWEFITANGYSQIQLLNTLVEEVQHLLPVRYGGGIK